MDYVRRRRTGLLNQGEKKFFYILITATLIFSIWFYLILSSRERFGLAHGYGLVSETKELIGILGIAAAFVLSTINYKLEKTGSMALISIGLGFILFRSILHSTHMINAMEPNTTLFQAVFEGENHFLLSIFDSSGAILIGLGITYYLKEKRRANALIMGAIAIIAVMISAVLIQTKGDVMMILNNMVVSHGISILPLEMALIPVIAFIPLTIFTFKLYNGTPSDFNRLFFIGSGFLFLRAMIHGIHTLFGIETHFFQSGFDALGGLAIAAAFYQTALFQRDRENLKIWAVALLILIMAAVYSSFVFFKFR